MNDLEAIAQHVEAVHRWRVAKRNRRSWSRSEKFWERKARELREDLGNHGITITIEKEQP